MNLHLIGILSTARGGGEHELMRGTMSVSCDLDVRLTTGTGQGRKGDFAGCHVRSRLDLK